jgi:putative transcriptional regulator
MKKAQFEELLESVREMKAIEKGQKKASRTFEFPPPNARQIRRKFQLTQSDFARLIGISVSTLRNWEQGLRHPEGPAQVLLRVVEAHPEAVFEVCAPVKIRAASAR